MKITRLYLRNFRTFEDEVDLELPAGLIGIYGSNGAGKSALIESIRWTLYGKARTGITEIRTTGVLADCITEVEFEHEGHLYKVRRTITGANSTQKVTVEADNQLMASTVTEVARYVHTILGMDDQAFRASVYAEQKQIAAFSSTQPGKRKELVLRLLGITPLDKARTNASKDARAAKEKHDQVKGVLGDLDSLHEASVDAKADANAAQTVVEEKTALVAAAKEMSETVKAALEDQRILKSEHDAVVNEGKVVAAEMKSATDRAATAQTELDALADAAAMLDELNPEAGKLGPAQIRLDAVRPVIAAQAELGRLPALAPPPEADESEVESRRQVLDEAAAEESELGGLLQAARQDVARARAAADRSDELTGEGTCPVCGQALGDAFSRVQAHRAEEAASAVARLTELTERHAAVTAAAVAAKEAATDSAATLKQAQAALAQHERLKAEHDSIASRLDALVAALDRPVAAGEEAELRIVVTAAAKAQEQVVQLTTRLERRPRLKSDLVAAQKQAQELTDKRQTLLDKVKALGFDQAEMDRRHQQTKDALALLDEATGAERQAREDAIRLTAKADAAEAALKTAEAQHEQVKDLAEESRHLDRLAKLMTEFRNEVVGSIGPRLAAQAADLFAELTDNEYDQLEVDPETYELQIRDAGRVFGMDRYSGSEVDLANLALRVAISEHTRMQSGGAVGLLVLDEVFGPLDSDRKERMLGALDRLKARFRQVLVVTHDQDIKEQLTNGIEVVKVSRRRATARLINQ